MRKLRHGQPLAGVHDAPLPPPLPHAPIAGDSIPVELDSGLRDPSRILPSLRLFFCVSSTSSWNAPATGPRGRTFLGTRIVLMVIPWTWRPRFCGIMFDLGLLRIKCGAILMCDIAHIGRIVAAKVLTLSLIQQCFCFILFFEWFILFLSILI